ncbi:MAG: hypothetical protein LBW77_06380 [Verrucomicrobiota bacterium]|nr:hypothetical protein [Verrucomicrobiota bacterium]
MKRNRKRTVHARVIPRPAVGAIVLVVTMTLIYWAVDSKCGQFGQDIRRNEQKLAALKDERVRERMLWDKNNTREKLEAALLQNGLAMDYPTAAQVVRMDASGQPVPGQISLVKFYRERSMTSPVVKNQAR